MQRKPLTADFHEPGFVATLKGENGLDFWFQLSDDDRRQAGVPWGPHNPQALNRYSYVLNAPVKAADPSGHAVPCKTDDCRPRVDVSGLPDFIKKVVAAGCVLLGCELDETKNVLVGPSPVDSVDSLMPVGMVGGGFKHAWIKRDLFQDLEQQVGKADFKKCIAALQKGLVGPQGESGIKIFDRPVNGYTHELKIGGSAQRLVGKIVDGILVFDRLIRGGYH